MLKRTKPILILTIAWLWQGCGDDGGAELEESCGVGQYCHCNAAIGCPGTEICVSGICFQRGDEDVGDTGLEITADAGDTGSDLLEDSGDRDRDLLGDSDDGTSADVEEDGTADVDAHGEGLSDTSADTGTDPDAVADLVPDVEPDEGPDASIAENPWIAFVSSVAGYSQIQFMRADGTGFADYESGAILEESPSWSPDGTMLAMTAYFTGETSIRLRVVDFDEGSQVDVPTGLSSLSSPDWSPSGDRIVVEGRLAGTSDNGIFIIDYPSGGDCSTSAGCSALTSPVGSDTSPVWTAVGERIYFARSMGSEIGAPFEIYFVSAGGGAAAQITSSSGLFGRFALSPDDDAIYYTRIRAPDTATRLSRRLIVGGAETTVGVLGDSDPALFSDGLRMAVTRRTIDTDTEIVLINALTGADISRLTNDTVSNFSASISSVDSSDIDISNYPR